MLARNISWNILKGIYDSLQIFNIYKTIKSSEVRNTLLFITFINGFIYMGFILCYLFILNPIITSVTNKIFIIGYFIELIINGFYKFWLLVIFLICNLITSYKLDTIYEKCTKHITGKETASKRSTLMYHLSRLFVVVSFKVYIIILNYIPKTVYLHYIVLAVQNSFYVFQYIYLKKSSDLKGIFYFVELNLSYFIGYGIMLSILLNLTDSITLQTGIFLLIFPYYMIASITVYHRRFEEKEMSSKKLIFLWVISKAYDTFIYIFKFILRGFGLKI
jgi:hypothetical protein